MELIVECPQCGSATGVWAPEAHLVLYLEDKGVGVLPDRLLTARLLFRCGTCGEQQLLLVRSEEVRGLTLAGTPPLPIACDGRDRGLQDPEADVEAELLEGLALLGDNGWEHRIPSWVP